MAAIAVMEMMKVAEVWVESSANTYDVFLGVALIYLVLTSVAGLRGKFAERRLAFAAMKMFAPAAAQLLVSVPRRRNDPADGRRVGGAGDPARHRPGPGAVFGRRAARSALQVYCSSCAASRCWCC